MRPVNLIPPERRRGVRGGSSHGVVGYAIVGVLALVLLVASAAAFFDGKIEERQAEVDSVEAQIANTELQAAGLAQFTTFKQLHDARVETIDSLAKSRFDWERVMRELAIVIPKRVWLTNLTGTVAPGVTVDNGAGIALRASAPGPALEVIGCARNQRTVARLIAAMHDIDGVSRVLVPSSAKPIPVADMPEVTGESAIAGAGDAAAAVGEVNTGDDCAVRSSYPTFELVAAFDGVTAAPVAPDAAIEPTTEVPVTTPATPATTTPTTTTTPSAPAPVAPDGGVAAAADDNAALQEDIAETKQEASQATDIVGGE